MEFKALKQEYLSQCSGDDWADAMSAWFQLAHELYLRGAEYPTHWEFKPAPGMKQHDPDDFLANEVFVHASTDALIKLGNILERYTRLLVRNDQSY